MQIFICPLRPLSQGQALVRTQGLLVLSGTGPALGSPWAGLVSTWAGTQARALEDMV